MAEWIRRRTSNPFYAGSNPAGGALPGAHFEVFTFGGDPLHVWAAIMLSRRCDPPPGLGGERRRAKGLRCVRVGPVGRGTTFPRKRPDYVGGLGIPLSADMTSEQIYLFKSTGQAIASICTSVGVTWG